MYQQLNQYLFKEIITIICDYLICVDDVKKRMKKLVIEYKSKVCYSDRYGFYEAGKTIFVKKNGCGVEFNYRVLNHSLFEKYSILNHQFHCSQSKHIYSIKKPSSWSTKLPKNY